MNPAIIVDSACDLPEEIIEKYQIEVLPYRLLYDGKEHLAGQDITLEEVYQRMAEGVYPRTAQVSPQTFSRAFKKFADKHQDCLYLAFSAKMSASYQSARLTAQQIKEKYENFNIEIIDTKSGSAAIGLMALKAAELREEGKSLADIIAVMEFMTEHIEHIFSLDSLTALQRGGRLSKGRAFLGNILNIKPILHVSDGEISLLEKVRGNRRVLPKMLEIMADRGCNLKEQLIGISHADDPERARELKGMIADELGCTRFMINKIGSILGAHLGIGGIGVFFFNQYPSENKNTGKNSSNQ